MGLFKFWNHISWCVETVFLDLFGGWPLWVYDKLGKLIKKKPEMEHCCGRNGARMGKIWTEKGRDDCPADLQIRSYQIYRSACLIARHGEMWETNWINSQRWCDPIFRLPAAKDPVLDCWKDPNGLTVKAQSYTPAWVKMHQSVVFIFQIQPSTWGKQKSPIVLCTRMFLLQANAECFSK